MPQGHVMPMPSLAVNPVNPYIANGPNIVIPKLGPDNGY